MLSPGKPAAGRSRCSRCQSSLSGKCALPGPTFPASGIGLRVRPRQQLSSMTAWQRAHWSALTFSQNPAAPPARAVASGSLDPRGSEEAGMPGPLKAAPVQPGDSYLLVNDRDQDMEVYDHSGQLLGSSPPTLPSASRNRRSSSRCYPHARVDRADPWHCGGLGTATDHLESGQNGEGGIRTHGPLRVAGFQDRSHQPLDHLSRGQGNRRGCSMPVSHAPVSRWGPCISCLA
jgi:hypothetical protein